ncbi:MAG: type I pullulanase [Mangrovibacterium sp.]
MMNFYGVDFMNFPIYYKDDLGVVLNSDNITAKVWAPTAQAFRMNIYQTSCSGEKLEEINLEKGQYGVWEMQHFGSYKGKYYTLQAQIGGEWMNETPGVDVRCTGVNGRRGLFFDPNQTNPVGWRNDKPISCENAVDAVLYELHVRDFSVAENSGMKYKGQFLAFTERNAKNTARLSTGIDHLQELGITHVHLMPVADYWTVDELEPYKRYNWGYDPLNYNNLEGSYATNKDDISRIIEFKKLIMALHKAGIGVILDVVYNHTGLTERSWFNQTVPGYYYRQHEDGSFSNASGCGNELATERAMVRNYIINSLKYWAEEFHVDGFRFDLMGIMDIETMQQIQRTLDDIRPGILLYGEGWAADKSPLDEHLRAIKKNIPQLGRIACFNDDFRDAIKGDNFHAKDKGFVNGKVFAEENVKFAASAACYHPQIEYGYTSGLHYAWAEQPYQVVNYVSCHDNFTLYDKLKFSRPDAGEDTIKRMHKLALALVLCSQGVPFLHGGSEFCRTKKGEHNSYNLGDYINAFDWDRKTKYQDVCVYVSKLIALRRSISCLRMQNANNIRNYLQFTGNYHKQTMNFTIADCPNELWRKLHFVFNARDKAFVHHLPSNESWTIIAEGDDIDINGLNCVDGNYIVVPPISMMALAVFDDLEEGEE